MRPEVGSRVVARATLPDESHVYYHADVIRVHTARRFLVQFTAGIQKPQWIAASDIRSVVPESEAVAAERRLPPATKAAPKRGSSRRRRLFCCR